MLGEKTGVRGEKKLKIYYETMLCEMISLFIVQNKIRSRFFYCRESNEKWKTAERDSVENLLSSCCHIFMFIKLFHSSFSGRLSKINLMSGLLSKNRIRR